MKIFLKRLVFLLLASTIGLLDYTNEVAANQKAKIVQAQAQVVPIVLPCLAKAILKGGGSKSGRITGIDAKIQQLILSQGKQSESIGITQIEKVKFYQECEASVRGGELSPIRGEKRIWSDIPLNNLRIRDANKGRAEVRLPSGVDPQIGKDRGSVYVVEELSFATGNKVNLGIVIVK